MIHLVPGDELNGTILSPENENFDDNVTTFFLR